MKMKTTLTVLLIMKLFGLTSALTKRHYFVNQTKTWIAAKLYCTTFYHDLSSFIDNGEENQFLEDTSLHQSSDAWVGLHRYSGVWQWSGGENATQIKWNISDKEQVLNDNWNNSNRQQDSNDIDDDANNCALIQSNHKKLRKESCTEKHVFFCMTRFALVRQNESWEGALEHCRKHYSDLGSLSSAFRMDSALEKVNQTQTEYVWTALRFLAGEWLWVTGDDLDHKAWPPSGQPQCPDANLRCGALDYHTGAWTNRDCEENLNFICH